MSAAADRCAALLARDGWCVLDCAVDAALVARIETDFEPRFAATPLCEGVFYGARTKRFGSLLTRASGIEQLVMHPLILSLVEQMLLPWCERIALNLTQAIEIHPGALPQLPHRDQDMWQGPKGEIEYLVNVMWPLTPFSRENGGTRLWTGSHFDQDVPVLPENESLGPTVRLGDALLKESGKVANLWLAQGVGSARRLLTGKGHQPVIFGCGFMVAAEGFALELGLEGDLQFPLADMRAQFVREGSAEGEATRL